MAVAAPATSPASSCSPRRRRRIGAAPNDGEDLAVVDGKRHPRRRSAKRGWGHYHLRVHGGHPEIAAPHATPGHELVVELFVSDRKSKIRVDFHSAARLRGSLFDCERCFVDAVLQSSETRFARAVR